MMDSTDSSKLITPMEVSQNGEMFHVSLRDSVLSVFAVKRSASFETTVDPTFDLAGLRSMISQPQNLRFRFEEVGNSHAFFQEFFFWLTLLFFSGERATISASHSWLRSVPLDQGVAGPKGFANSKSGSAARSLATSMSQTRREKRRND
jgi:hypothetical protein